MMKKKLKILNKLGIHARAAAKFVACANLFKSDLVVTKDKKKANGKSIMEVMLLAAEQNAVITLVADGHDEKEMLKALEQLIEDYFGENE